ncbi:hypothetical protein ACIO3S_25430 [Nocardioides sp. NPDC087217]|uniref:hypothetical protein n=1 Tax=Nocardioides sp. NPDC087217 TaxID=3364335 RepID=UPI0038073C83
MRTASTWPGVRALAPVVLLGAVTSACMNVTVQVDPAPTSPTKPTTYYGTVETVEEARWSTTYADDPTYETYETWDDCWAS